MARKTKKLLGEATINRWSKLANLKKPSRRRLHEMCGLDRKGLAEMEDEEEFELGDEAPVEEPQIDDLGGVDDVPVDEPPIDDLGAEVPGAEGGNEELVTQLVDAIATAIEDVAGVPVNVEGGEGDVEAPVPAGDEVPVPGDEAGLEGGEEIEPAPGDEYVGDEEGDELVAESEAPKVTDGGFDLSKDDAASHRKGVGTDGAHEGDSTSVQTASPPPGQNLPKVTESEEIEEEEEKLEEDDGADWKGEDAKLSKTPEANLKPQYEARVRKIAKRVAQRLVKEARKRKASK